jgi:hypothetical protein
LTPLLLLAPLGCEVEDEEEAPFVAEAGVANLDDPGRARGIPGAGLE